MSNWSTSTRKKITEISKGIAEILAELAEPFMRYSTVYLALATSIKAIYYPPVYSLTEGIVIAAPEFVLLGALSIAENAIQAGQKKWGYILLCICLALAGVMIATFVDIFLIKFTDDALKYLNFARCLVAVGFSIALGKLEGETTMIEDYPSTGTTDPSMGTTTAPESTRATSTAPLLGIEQRFVQKWAM